MSDTKILKQNQAEKTVEVKFADWNILQEFCKSYSVELLDVLQASWAIVLAIGSGNPNYWIEHDTTSHDLGLNFPRKSFYKLKLPNASSFVSLVNYLHTDTEQVQGKTFDTTFKKAPQRTLNFAMDFKGESTNKIILASNSGNPMVTLITGLSQDQTEKLVTSFKNVISHMLDNPNQTLNEILAYDLESSLRSSHGQSVQEIYSILFTSQVSNTSTSVTGHKNHKADEFWTQKLSDADTGIFPQLPNPQYHPTPSDFLSRETTLSGDLVRNLSPSVIAAAWAIVSANHTGSKNVTFGYQSSGNAIPLQLELDENEQIGQSIEKIEGQLEDLLPFNHDSLDDIQQLSSSTAAACGFQTRLRIANAQDAGDQEVLDRRSCALLLNCKWAQNSLSIVARFDDKVLASQSLGWVLRQFTDIVEDICLGKDEITSDAGAISLADRTQILQWNSRLPPTVDDCVHHGIARMAAHQPDAEAVYAWDGKLTYRKLDTLSTTLGHHLRRLGVRPGSFVPFCLEKSMWTPVTVLAIMKAGGVGVPLEPAHPHDRKVEMIEDVSASLIISSVDQSQSCEALTSSMSTKTELVVVGKALLDNLPSSDSQVCDDVLPSHPAYVIFTSGSTGKPKGVIWEHRCLSSSIGEHGKALFFDRKPRVLQFAAHVFDISVADTFTTLTYGGCICIPSDFDRVNNIAGFIKESRVDWAFFTPTFARMVKPEDVPSLKTLLLGGEKVGQDNVENWRRHLQLLLVYGPAETCIYCSANEVSIGSAAAENIGRTFGGRLWITDPNDPNRLLPLGMQGEILIEGPILAHSYLNDPEKTNNAFIFNPLWAGSESTERRRFYRTGDLGRYTADGTIAITGRKDNQVKMRGQRMELGEVEHHLVHNDIVNHAIAMVPEAGASKGRLVVVFTLAGMVTPGASLQIVSQTLKEEVSTRISELREHLSRRLPVYMIPTLWIPIQDFPLTLSRKLDRMEVKRWVVSLTVDGMENIIKLSLEKSQAMPTTAMETLLHEIWSSVLNIAPEQIGIDSSFLKLGGDSITAIQIVSKCRAKSIEISVQDILRHKTIRQVAPKLRTVEQRTSDVVEKVDTPFDLSPIQAWHMKRVGEAKNHFNQSFILKLNKTISKKALDSALRILLDNHALLRARFRRVEGTDQWEQYFVANSAQSFLLSEHDIGSTAEVERLIHRTQESFDIESGPLVGADLLNVNAEYQLLFLAVHHAFIDLVSWRVIMEDIEEILTSGKSLSPKSLSFSTWLQLQKEHVQTSIQAVKTLPYELPKADFEYWGMESRPSLSQDTIRKTITINKYLSSNILGSCNDTLGTNPVDLLLSAILDSFGQVFTDRELPTIFNEGHGREPWDRSIDITRTVGWFTVMSPIYIQGLEENSLINTVKRVKDARRSIQKNGWEYFASRFLTPEGQSTFAHHDQMEILFNYFGLYQQLERKDGLLSQMPSGSFALGDVSPSFPEWALFEIEVGVEEGRLLFHFSYNRFMKHQDKIQTWINQCESSIEAIVAELSGRASEFTLADFPLLSIDYQDLTKLAEEILPSINRAKADQIESIYPCSPMQEGILVAQTRQQEHYKVQDTFQVSSKQGLAIDVVRLEVAWRNLVKYHPILRTVFIANLSKSSLYQQIVLKSHEPAIFHLNAKDHEDAISKLDGFPAVIYDSTEPPHRVGICQLENGDVYFRLEVNHAIIDATSTQIICRELGNAYDGTLSQSMAPLYEDYISYIHQQPLGLSLDYWKQYLSNVKPSRFPNLNDGEVQESGKIDTLTLSLNDVNVFNSFCKQHGVTMANLISVAWAVLLQTYTGEDDVCFGYLASGRDLPIPEIQDSVGPFINMLVSRIDLSGKNSIYDTLQSVQTDYISANSHQICSLAEVYHSLNLGGEKLFNTAISLEKKWSVDLAPESSVLIKEVHLNDPTDFDLVFNVAYSNEELKAAITYDISHISRKQAANVADTLEKILISITESEAKNIVDIDRLGSQTLQQLLTWNEGLPGSLDNCVHQAIHEQAVKDPEAIAICAWDGNLTYAQLDNLSDRVSHYLASQGVGKEIVVPLAFEKSRWVVVTQVGVLKAGGACLTMDMTHPVNRLQAMLKQVGAKLMLAEPNFRSRFESCAIDIATIDESFILSLPDQSGPACTDVKPDNMGFVVFTSGSTGNPKGIMLEHKTVCTSSRGHAALFEVGPGSRCFAFSAFAFDVYISDIFTPLMYGGCCCMPRAKEIMDDLAGAINRLQATSTYITPTVATLFRPEDAPTLKKVALGGEPLTKDNARLWGGQVYLINVFGPSETSNWVSYRHVLPDTTQPSNIGPGVYVNIWIVDAQTNEHLVPIGCVGEMFIEGPILSRGYINDPEKTEATFTMNPPFLKNIQDGTNRRFYGTGDLVRANSDGSLLYVGRKDSQIKISGQRLELGEVEYALRDAPEVAQISVVLPKSGLCKGQMVAVITLNDISTGDEADAFQIPSLTQKKEVQHIIQNIIDRVSSRLAAWMIPRVWAVVDHIPLSPSGKLDRSRIKQWVFDIKKETLNHISAITQYDTLEQPTSTVGKVLQGLWSQVLNLPIEEIGVQSSFLRLGGDSLSIMRLVTKARSHGLVLSTAAVFRNPRLGEMEVLAKEVAPAAVDDVGPFSMMGLNEDYSLGELLRTTSEKFHVQRDSIQDIYPCTALQVGLVALSLAQPGAYVAINVYRLPQSLDIALFRAACELVYSQNPILRTRIVDLDSFGMCQMVLDNTIKWQTSESVEKHLQKERQTPIQLGSRLTRFAIIDGHFIMTSHHATYDGWSLSNYLEDIAIAYKNSIPEVRPPFKNFIKYLQDFDYRAADAFWASKLIDPNTAMFPRLPQPQYQVRADAFLTENVPLVRSSTSEITTSTIIQAAWAIVASQYLDEHNVTFGVLVSGRNAPVPGIEQMLGPTIATIPLQIEIEPSLSIKEYLAQVQSDLIEVMKFEQTGLQRIRNINAATAAACFFQTQLVIQPNSNVESQFKLLEIEQLNDESDDTLTYAQTFECILTSTGVKINALFDDQVVSIVQMQRILQQFGFVLEKLAQDADETTLSEIMTTDASDETQILSWNSLLPDTIQEFTHHKIQQWVETDPDSPAVTGWDGDFTKKELDILSNNLARHLALHGVGPNIFVPFCFEKSKWAIVSCLAILKAGGVCVPLEPQHPLERIRFMVQEVGAKVVLSSKVQKQRCAEISDSVIVVDDESISQLPFAEQMPEVDLTPDHPAYVIFTSGSTGKPKAVIWKHSTLSSSIAKHGQALNFIRQPRVLHFASCVFDASVAEVLDILSWGGCICIPNDIDKAENIVYYINVMKVDWMFQTPTFARLLQPEDVPTLKTLVLGGEALGQDNIKKWVDKVQLINAYGPSECCILAATHEFKPELEIHETIGRPVGCLMWLVKVHDSESLVPIGAVGEILVEGPTLAQGYLNDDEKNAASFISGPAWSRRLRPVGCVDETRRFYKTGDLGKYNSDGTITFVGRKDSQIKLRGQRMELGEVEATLNRAALIETAVALIPSAGPCKGQLTTIFTFPGVDLNNSSAPLEVVARKSLGLDLRTIQEHMAQRVPRYMVPSLWLPVNSFPHNVSGKIDRPRVRDWINNIDQSLLDSITRTVGEQKVISPTSAVEEILQSVWSHTLNKPVATISRNSDFYKLGGDSIVAILVASRCRREGIDVSVPDILRYPMLCELALYTKTTQSTVELAEEQLNTPFLLSPIQQMHIEQLSSEDTYFNQSFLLQIKKPIAEGQLRAALEIILDHHSMLRARFVQGKDGHWSQMIKSNIGDSYRLNYHNISNETSLQSTIKATQSNINLRTGPLFGADVFSSDDNTVENPNQLLFITAHHLVVDLVSWRIILQDLEDILKTGALHSHKSLSFQTWIDLQCKQAKSLSVETSLPTKIPSANYSYWGMEDSKNLVKDIKEVTISIDADRSSVLLSEANNALNTEPLDLFLAATAHAFAQTFTDRDAPAIFNEGHGREPWEPAIDISRTVGWFTILSPLFVDASSDIIGTICEVKDTRRRIPYNGLPYFSSRAYSANGQAMFKDHERMELVFNYSGQYQQLERKDSLLSQSNLQVALYEQSPDFEQSGLFNIDAGFENNILKFSFKYNKHMQHQTQISAFIKKSQQTLEEIADRLPMAARQTTQTDFPLLTMTASHVVTLTNLLPKLGLTSPDEIEDFYPCVPMQEGILVAQAKEPALYFTQNIWELTSRDGHPDIDAERILTAWQAVVKRHAILRTIFVQSISDERAMFQQLVVKDTTTKQFIISSDSDEEGIKKLKEHPCFNSAELAPPHQLGIFKSAAGRTYIRLEISHALTDAISTQLILNEISQAYKGQLSITRGPLYSEYVGYLSKQSKEVALNYWMTYLQDATPCLLPGVDCKQGRSLGVQSIDVPIPNAALLHSFCIVHGVTVASVLQSVWALVLQCYSGGQSTCFGYITSGRDLPISNIADCVGPMISMLTCRVQFEPSDTVLDVITRVQKDHSNALSNRISSIAEIHHAIGRGSDLLFNTGFSVQKASDEDLHENISFKHIQGSDPSDFDLVTNITYSPDEINATINYQADFITEIHARNIHDTFSQILSSILHAADKPILEIEKLGDFNHKQILEWNRDIPRETPSLIHERFEEEVDAHPYSQAVCAWDGELTYVELDRLSTKLALYLQVLGVTTEILVPFCFDKSMWTIVSVLAIIKAGGACVPLEPGHPSGRKKTMVDEVKAQLILCSESYADECATLVDQVLIINQGTIQNLPASNYKTLRDNTRETIRPDNSVYVIFTSGSTGKPKGVVWAHANLSSSITYHGAAFEVDRHTRMLQFASHVFDASAYEILTTLLQGGCVCVPSDQNKLTGFTTYINSMNVNSAFLTATFARHIDPDSVPTLKTLVLGGEPVGQDNVNKWSQKLKLINGWGTAETTIACSMAVITPALSNINTIGAPFGSIFWITDQDNVNRLLPIGAVGELLVEGPILAREYLGDAEKTAKSFISEPKWAQAQGHNAPRRIYRTGDLAKYEPDGTLIFIGRRDNQTKVRGQRIELGEVEHNLLNDGIVEHAIATVPDFGILQGKLVATLTLKEMSSMQAGMQGSSLSLLSPQSKSRVSSQISSITDTLSSKVPVYMVPTIWIPVETIPLTATGKLDRVTVATWIRNISQEILNEVSALINSSEASKIPMTTTEARLQAIWAEVLNLPVENITANSSFLKLGGDSITAIQLSSKARAQNIHITVPTILRYKTLSQIALQAKIADPFTESPRATEEPIDQKFGLAPIQQMHIDSLSMPGVHFNQSFLLQLNIDITPATIRSAIEILIQHHSLLRARFHSPTSLDAQWSATVTKDISQSYLLNVHPDISGVNGMKEVIRQTQTRLNFQAGPIFAAEVFLGSSTISDEPKESCYPMLFLTASHLIIDLVSWRVILQDLEEILTTGTLSAPVPLPFQSWLNLQSEHASKAINVHAVLPFKVQCADINYWGMEGQKNAVNDMKEVDFSLNREESSIMLGAANDALGTEPLDLFLSAIMHSFAQTFDRQLPEIYNEGHGRETWDSSVDISRTVGWFTTLCPIATGSTAKDSLFDVVRKVKDVRAKIPQNGWQYFTARFLTGEGRKAFANNYPEIVFNYGGQYQQLERKAGLFSAVPFDLDLNEQSPDLELQSLFSIAASVQQGQIKISFTYNRLMQRQTEIDHWISGTKLAMQQIVSTFPYMEKQLTLSDLPYLDLDYQRLDSVLAHVKSQIGDTEAKIQDIVPATDYQTDSLAATLAKTRGDLNYLIFDIKGPLDVTQLQKSLLTLLERHSILRSIFLIHGRQLLRVVLDEGQFDFLHYSEAQYDPMTIIQEDMQVPIELGKCNIKFLLVNQGHLHQSLILRIPHAYFDSISMGLIIHELQTIYEGDEAAPTFSISDFFKYKSDNSADAKAYWTETLHGVSPTRIFNKAKPEHKEYGYGVVEESIPLPSLQQHGIQVASLVKGAWAVLLAQLSGKTNIVFGDLASGRSMPINGIESMTDVCINYIPLKIHVNKSLNVVDYLREVQESQISSMPFEFLGLREIISNCTDWPAWTTFGSTVNHTNLPFAQKPLSQGATKWTFNQFTPGGNQDDLSIESHPNGSNLDISIIFGDKRLPRSYIQGLLDRLCSIITSLAEHPDVSVESLFRGFTSDSPKIPIPYAIGPILPRSALIGPTHNQDSLAGVERVWRNALKDHSNDIEGISFSATTPFHSVWSHPIAAAHLAQQYKAEGIDISMEDIFAAPSVGEQVALFSDRLQPSRQNRLSGIHGTHSFIQVEA
ncbi:hypothetical protein PVAG01_00534 [Phlyctema vagabunda]|uniref:Carrier domain-containing protein n=1 Tax=Phlyctema vagabunda TaxID=108571 RepID=A0ABR4PUW8_9HELO